MNTAVAITAMINLINAATILLGKGQEISAIIAKAQAEGRDVTQAELDSIIAEDDAARVALNAAILKSGG